MTHVEVTKRLRIILAEPPKACLLEDVVEKPMDPVSLCMNTRDFTLHLNSA